MVDPWFQVAIAAVIVVASAMMAQFYPVQWISFRVQVVVGAVVIAASAIAGAWATQLTLGWWRKRGETA